MLVSEVMVYTWSHSHPRTILMATHWLIRLAKGKGTVLNMTLHLAEFPYWSRTRDQVLRHCRLGSSFLSFCSSLTMLSTVIGLGKQNSIIRAQGSGLAPVNPGIKGSWNGFWHSFLLVVWEPLLREEGEIKSDVLATATAFPFPPNVPEQLQYLNVSGSFRVFWDLHIFQAED